VVNGVSAFVCGCVLQKPKENFTLRAGLVRRVEAGLYQTHYCRGAPNERYSEIHSKSNQQQPRWERIFAELVFGFGRSVSRRRGAASSGQSGDDSPDSARTLREDYAMMQQMFFGEPPDIGKIMEVLKQWESEFNQA